MVASNSSGQGFAVIAIIATPTLAVVGTDNLQIYNMLRK